jgi:hypothetical protein
MGNEGFCCLFAHAPSFVAIGAIVAESLEAFGRHVFVEGTEPVF